MNKVKVEITGTTHLMMHNPITMRSAGGGRKTIPTPEEEAKTARYVSGDGKKLVILADHVHSCLKLASRGFRISGREQVYPYICGSIEIQPEEIPLIGPKNANDYVIDTRRCVVQRVGIMRSRPKIWPWAAKFELIYDEEVFAQKFIDGVLKEQIFKRAGTGIGLLEYRPHKGGRFGRFAISGWES